MLGFRPRVLIDIEKTSLSTSFLGQPVDFPMFVAPAALARLGHPDGEKCIVEGASKHNGTYCISSNASCSLEELFEARDQAEAEGGKINLWFQLYVNRDRKKTEEIVKKAAAGGCTTIVLTVDAPVGGRRERDLRAKGSGDLKLNDAPSVSSVQFSYLDGRGSQLESAKAIPNSALEGSLGWSDLDWIKSLAPETKLVISELSLAVS